MVGVAEGWGVLWLGLLKVGGVLWLGLLKVGVFCG